MWKECVHGVTDWLLCMSFVNSETPLVSEIECCEYVYDCVRDPRVFGMFTVMCM